MALSKDVVIRLLGDAKSAVDAQKAAADAAEVTAAQYRKAEREFDRQTKAMETAAKQQRAAMEQVGRGSMIAGATVVAGLGLATKAAMDWESAWTGVLKTVNGSPAELAKLESGLRSLARTLPATHTEIAAVAEAAGQLGIQTDSILEFTKVMIDLGETTNLSADEAATSIAQMMNVMQTAPEDVGNLGATLVALGNAGASTEKQIVEMAQRISGAGAVVGLTESDVLAFANAVASMGIEVESGGSSVSRVLTDMSKAAQMGGDELMVFAETAGMSTAEFARAFREDPAEAFASFIEGLGGIQEAGGNVFAVLDDLGLSDVRVSQALLGMASSGDLLRDSLNLGSEAWRENTALIEEAAKRYDTTAAKTEMARNAINDAAIEIGDVFIPVLASLAESVADIATWFAELPQPVQNALAGLSGIAGVGMLAGGAFLLLAPRVMETYKAFQLLNTAHPGVASGLSKVGRAAGVAGAIIAVTAAVKGLTSSMEDAPPSMEETTEALLNLGENKRQLDSMFSNRSTVLFGDDLRGLADAARELTDPSLLDRLDDFGGELASLGGDEGRPERDALVDQLDQMGRSLALMVQSGNTELAAQSFKHLSEEWKEGGGTVAQLKELMPAYAEALTAVENEQSAVAESSRLQGEQAKVLAQDLDVAYGSLQGYAAALGMSEGATADLIQKSSELGESLGAFIDPLGAYVGLLEEKRAAEEATARSTAEATGSAEDSWEDYVREVDVSLDEYMARLEEQITAQSNWQVNMLMLAGRVSQGTIDELARMGPEGAALVADLVNASDAELSRFDEVTRARSKEATDAWGAQLTMAAPVLAQIGKSAGQGVVDELAAKLRAGTTTVAQIAAQYGIELAGGINPILKSLGGRQIAFGGRGMPEFAGGGYTGDGGKYDPKGVVHGGEYVVTKERTARLGVRRLENLERILPNYAAGGFVSTSAVPKPRSTAPYQPPISTVGDATMQRAYEEAMKWLAANLEPPAPAGGSSNGLLPIMAAARQYVMDTYGVRNIGGYANRNIAGTNVKSDHAMGKAIDIMTSNLGLGWNIARDFAAGPAHSRFKAENVIWQQSISSNGGPFKGMADRGSPTQNHRDHVHVDTYQTGTPYVARNGFAYLHKGEAIVPSGINAASRAMPSRPVGSSGGGGGAQVLVNVSGAVITGTLTVDGDGIARMVDGQIVDAFATATNRGGYNPR